MSASLRRLYLHFSFFGQFLVILSIFLSELDTFGDLIILIVTLNLVINLKSPTPPTSRKCTWATMTPNDEEIPRNSAKSPQIPLAWPRDTFLQVWVIGKAYRSEFIAFLPAEFFSARHNYFLPDRIIFCRQKF